MPPLRSAEPTKPETILARHAPSSYPEADSFEVEGHLRNIEASYVSLGRKQALGLLQSPGAAILDLYGIPVPVLVPFTSCCSIPP